MTDRSIFTTVNDRAGQIATFGWVVVIVFTLTAIVMWVLLAWAAVRTKGSFDEHLPIDREDGKRWIYIGSFGVALVVMLALFVPSIVLMFTASTEPHDHAAQASIRVIGHRWWWEVQYIGDRPDRMITSANEIHIPVGEEVTIQLLSADVIHSFWVPNLQGKVDLVPGQVNEIAIRADKPGRYDGQCAELCGEQHAKMRLVVIADPPDDYAKWMANEANDAEPPHDMLGKRGLEVFEGKACSLCHTIRGTRALGRVGPDLTHLAARHGLAAESLPLTHATVAGWSTRAQSLKPGVAMPNLTTMTGNDLDALQTYLMELR